MNIIAQEKLGQINDPDGYTNVREQKTSKSKIKFKVYEEEYFYFEELANENWFKITNMDGDSGFMHKSRIKEITEFKFKGKTYKASEIKLKIRVKNIGETFVRIIQIKNEKTVCDAFVEVYNEKTEKFDYEYIDPLGGSAGISFLEDAVPNHLILTKHGSYDGRTIIVNNKGKVTEMTGGSISKIINNKYLLNFEECDLGYCGMSVYDLQKDEIVLTYSNFIEGLFFYKNKIYIHLQNVEGNSKEYVGLDLKNLKLKEKEILELSREHYFEDWLRFELKDGCLCY
ncbi:hypothetical protein [Aureivirga sp. CE67]|uniref:hypothetical protein n=1 Tax=Aureivirga sp. CE67 TaxID=1788983 RepID=UPI0018CBABA7|nr:hypothetical protein [Aureivirga sp. CE67]